MAASIQCAVLFGTDAKPTAGRTRLKLSEIQRMKRLMAEGSPKDNGSEQRGLQCRKCGCRHFRVVYTRAAWGGKLVRRRECRRCGARITTWERAVGGA